MTSNRWLQIALFGSIVVVITRPFGGYMTRVLRRASVSEPATASGRTLGLFGLWCRGDRGAVLAH
jgi:hypothetical protein